MGVVERSASTVVTEKPHGLTTRTAERSVSTTQRVQCRALDHRGRKHVTVKPCLRTRAQVQGQEVEGQVQVKAGPVEQQ